jgi:hypothetical protein
LERSAREEAGEASRGRKSRSPVAGYGAPARHATHEEGPPVVLLKPEGIAMPDQDAEGTGASQK